MNNILSSVKQVFLCTHKECYSAKKNGFSDRKSLRKHEANASFHPCVDKDPDCSACKKCKPIKNVNAKTKRQTVDLLPCRHLGCKTILRSKGARLGHERNMSLHDQSVCSKGRTYLILLTVIGCKLCQVTHDELLKTGACDLPQCQHASTEDQIAKREQLVASLKDVIEKVNTNNIPRWVPTTELKDGILHKDSEIRKDLFVVLPETASHSGGCFSFNEIEKIWLSNHPQWAEGQTTSSDEKEVLIANLRSKKSDYLSYLIRPITGGTMQFAGYTVALLIKWK
jgi:hypothetical protein